MLSTSGDVEGKDMQLAVMAIGLDALSLHSIATLEHVECIHGPRSSVRLEQALRIE